MNRRTFLKSAASIPIIAGLPVLSKRTHAMPTSSAQCSILIVAHMDDEVLWFLPWLGEVDRVIIASLPYTNAHLNILSKYANQYDALWQFGRGITSFQEYTEIWLDKDIRRGLITDWHYDVMLRDTIANPNITEIFTHNPWGEYGHLHHKQVSDIVRRLAVEYHKDVWCPNLIVRFTGYNDPLAIYDKADLPEFRRATGYFNLSTLQKIRQYYTTEFVNQTFPINYWTWGGPRDFPLGYQEFFLAVSGGVDFTKEIDLEGRFSFPKT